MIQEFLSRGFEIRGADQTLYCRDYTGQFYPDNKSGNLAVGRFQMMHQSIGEQGLPVHTLRVFRRAGVQPAAIEMRIDSAPGVGSQLNYAKAAIRTALEGGGFTVSDLAQTASGDEIRLSLSKKGSEEVAPADVMLLLAKEGFVHTELAAGALKNRCPAQHAALTTTLQEAQALFQVADLARREGVSRETLQRCIELAKAVEVAKQARTPGAVDLALGEFKKAMVGPATGRMA